MPTSEPTEDRSSPGRPGLSDSPDGRQMDRPTVGSRGPASWFQSAQRGLYLLYRLPERLRHFSQWLVELDRELSVIVHDVAELSLQVRQMDQRLRAVEEQLTRLEEKLGS